MLGRMMQNENKRLRVRVLQGFLGFLLAVLLSGCGPKTYTVAHQPGVWKVITYNLHGVAEAQSIRKRTDILAQYCVNNRVDVILGQEFVGGPLAAFVHLVEDGAMRLGKQLSYSYYSTLSWNLYGLDYRTGVVSRWDQASQISLPLSHNKSATLVWADGIWWASVHASSSSPLDHLETVLSRIPPLEPAVVGGDFNSSSSDMETLATRFGFTEAHPSAEIDRIFVRGFQIVSSQVIDLAISDHNGMLITLRR